MNDLMYFQKVFTLHLPPRLRLVTGILMLTSALQPMFPSPLYMFPSPQLYVTTDTISMTSYYSNQSNFSTQTGVMSPLTPSTSPRSEVK